MGNDDILIPGAVLDLEPPRTPMADEEYLKIINALSEIKENGSQVTARNNLGVYGTEEVTELVNEVLHNLEDAVSGLKKTISNNKSESLDSYDQLTSLLKELSTKEETNTLKQELLNTLTTKLKSYLTSGLIDERIVQSLVDYVTSSEVYKKDDVYNKKEIDREFKNYIKTDGSTPFTSTQIGVYPKLRKELATKGYSDDCMKNHKNEADPHGFTTILNEKLNNYYKKAEVYTKALTYDRVTLDSMVDKLVKLACGSLIEEHINTISHLTSQDVLRVVKTYALENLLSKEDYERASNKYDESLEQVEETLTKLIEEKAQEFVWHTSGPVESTVGHVEDKTPVPDTMTFQEIMDAIFYGLGIYIEAPDFVIVGDTCDVTLCVHGSSGLISYAELYQDGELIYTFTSEDFKDGCVTVESNAIFDDTVFDFKVYYTNGSMHETSKTVQCALPMFVGLLPKWKQAYTISMDYLKELAEEDTEGNENRFITEGKNLTSITFKYEFQDPKLRHPFIVVPASYPDLESMVTKSQSFGIEAFDVIDSIPLQISGIEQSMIFKVYVYRLALSSLNQEVTFNFKSKE